MPINDQSSRRKLPSDELLNELVTVSKNRGLQPILDEFVNAPKTFDKFNRFPDFEYNARKLALDYMDKVQKKVYPSSVFLHDMANRSANEDSDYDFLKEFLKDPKKKVKNEHFVETIKTILKDCIDTAYHLANHRIEFRSDNRVQQILEDTTDILQKINHMFRHMQQRQAAPANNMAIANTVPAANILPAENTVPNQQQKTDVDVPMQPEVEDVPDAPQNLVPPSDQPLLPRPINRSRTVAPTQPQPAPPQTLRLHLGKNPPQKQPRPSTRSRTIAAPEILAEPEQPIPAQIATSENQQRPNWIVPEEQCQHLLDSTARADDFVRAYLLELFSTAELLLPAKEVERTKIIEFLSVAKHFYPEKGINWNEKFNKMTQSIRLQQRKQIFEEIKDSIGFGISNNNVKFYFKPSSDLNPMLCYRKLRCTENTRMPTKQIGTYNIPENLNEFEFIVLIQKPGFRSTITKLFPDGTSYQVQK